MSFTEVTLINQVRDIGPGYEVANSSGRHGADTWISSTLSPSADYVLGTYLIFTMVMSLCLNSLVLVTIYRRPQPATSVEYYVINMAVCHVMHVLFALPSIIIACFRHGWYMNLNLCIYEATVVFFCGNTSIYNLTTMSVIRYIKTCHAGQGNLISKMFVVRTLIIAYMNAALWTFSPLLGWGSYGPETFGISCTLAWTELPDTYIYGMFIIGFVLPILLMVFSYTAIVRVVRMSAATSSVQSGKDVYITKMAFLMCVCFIAEWTPYACVSIIHISGSGNVPTILSVLAPVIAKSSTWSNPIIYFLVVKRFRNDVIKHVFNLSRDHKERSRLRSVSEGETLASKTVTYHTVVHSTGIVKLISPLRKKKRRLSKQGCEIRLESLTTEENA